MTKRQRIINKALAARMPTITHSGFMRWYAGGVRVIRESRGPNRILSATAAAVGYIYRQLGRVNVPRRNRHQASSFNLAEALSMHDMDTLMVFLGVLKQCRPEQKAIDFRRA